MELSSKEAAYFLTIAEERNLTRAAQKMYISQPSMTQFLQKLERQLGVKLFVRNGYSMRLTYEGECLATTCKKIVKLCRDFDNELDDIKQLNKGRVIIGMPFNLLCYVFPLFYPVCQAEIPDIRVIPVEGYSKDLELMIQDGRVDFAVLPLPLGTPDDFEVRTIIEEQLILSVPKNYKINQYAQYKEGEKYQYLDIHLADREPFVLGEPEQRVQKAIEVIFGEADITPKTAFVTKDVTKQIIMSAFGLGMTVFPEHYLAFSNPREEVNYYYISGVRNTGWKVGVVWEKDTYLSNAHNYCIDILTRIFN